MKISERSLFGIKLSSIAFFMASIFIGAVGEASLSYSFNGQENDLVAFAIRGILYILAAICLVFITSLLRTLDRQEDLIESRAFRVSIQRDDPTNSIPGAAYGFCSEIAMQAQKSIVVIGPHFTSLPHLEMRVGSESHDHYLTNGMEKAVRSHVKSLSRESDFSYTRIVQMDPEDADAFSRDEEHSISSDTIGNQTLARHISRMLKLNKKSHNIDVKVYAREFIPSFPSTLIIDDRYVFFSLPSMISSSGEMSVLEESGIWIENLKRITKILGQEKKQADENLTAAGKVAGDLLEHALEANVDGLKYDFVLAIEDASGVVPMAFRQMITQFEINGFEIKDVEIKNAETKDVEAKDVEAKAPPEVS